MVLSPSSIENILVMGKSGAGKQSFIDIFINDFRLKQLSTGQIFRSFMKIFDACNYKGEINQFYDNRKKEFLPPDEIKKILGSDIDNSIVDDFILGLKATFYVKNGLYVPDNLTNMLFSSFFANSGYKGMVLDGYPRTPVQAEFLLSLTKGNNTRIDAIILVENEDDIIIARTIGRRICPSCSTVFNIASKPPKDGKYCTKCGTEVITRSDDTKEKLQTRLHEFRDKTMPAIHYLEEKEIPIVKVQGNLPVFTDEAVKENLFSGLHLAHLL